MPELPEVETIVRQLDHRLSQCIVKNLVILDKKLKNDSLSKLLPTLKNARAQGASRLGKLAILRFSPAKGPDLHLSIHLRMTGRLIWGEDGIPPNQRNPRVILECDRGSLYFCDTRRFGVMELCSTEDLPCASGIDPTTQAFSAAVLSDLIRGSVQAIKPWLMRQDRLCGIGNIYASEILFESKISPHCRACDLRRGELRVLAEATKKILLRAIEHCGVTFSDFQDSNGRMGSYQEYLGVYGRNGEPCKRCGANIMRCVQQQRSTFFCPSCQS